MPPTGSGQGSLLGSPYLPLGKAGEEVLVRTAVICSQDYKLPSIACSKHHRVWKGGMPFALMSLCSGGLSVCFACRRVMADASRIRKELAECQRDKKSGVTAR